MNKSRFKTRQQVLKNSNWTRTGSNKDNSFKFHSVYIAWSKINIDKTSLNMTCDRENMKICKLENLYLHVIKKYRLFRWNNLIHHQINRKKFVSECFCYMLINVYLQYNNLKNLCTSYLNRIFWFSRPVSMDLSFLLSSNFIISLNSLPREDSTGFNRDLVENRIIYVSYYWDYT